MMKMTILVEWVILGADIEEKQEAREKTIVEEEAGFYIQKSQVQAAQAVVGVVVVAAAVAAPGIVGTVGTAVALHVDVEVVAAVVEP